MDSLGKQFLLLLLFSVQHSVQLFVTSWTAALQASLTIPQSLSKFMSIASVIPSSHLILWCPLFLLPSIFPSIRDFSSELSGYIRWPKYWSFSFSISPSSIQGWPPLRLNGLIFLLFKRLWGVFSSTTNTPLFKGIISLALCLLYGPPLSTGCDHWEDHSLDYTDIYTLLCIK